MLNVSAKTLVANRDETDDDTATIVDGNTDVAMESD